MRGFIRAKSDAEIQRALLDELALDRRVAPTEVGVEVDNRVVTLTGTVSSWAKKLAAEEVAHRVDGVLDVANDLVVRDRTAARPSDTEVAGAIRQALIRDPLVPEERIQTTVRDGIVTVQGAVGEPAERDEAIRVIRTIRGVCGIDDQVVVRPMAPARPPASPEEIETLLGDVEAVTIARIRTTDATVDEVAEALADVEHERRFGVRRQPSTARAAEVRAILEELLEVEDEEDG